MRWTSWRRCPGTATGAAHASFSDSGSLVYLRGLAQINRILVWVDRQGREEELGTPPRAYNAPRISPDGTRVAVEVQDQEADIWIWDLARQTLTRLTFDPSTDTSPVWTRDGQRIAFASRVFYQESGKTGRDVRMLVMGNERRSVPLVEAESNQYLSDVSPDGRWLAYESIESGTDQIYVRPFPDVGAGKWQVSADGGQTPVWSPNGRELFYVAPGGRMMAVPIQAGSSFSAGTPQPTLEGRYLTRLSGLSRGYDVSPDGERFLMLKAEGADGETPPAELILVQNWFEELKRLVPPD